MNLLSGVIIDNKPFVRAKIKNGNLVFSKRGPLRFIVDTGFTGDLLIPQNIVKQLKLAPLSYETFVLATGQERALPVYYGHVALGKIVLEVEMVAGDALIGMSLLQALGSQLTLNFDTRKVTLTG